MFRIPPSLPPCPHTRSSVYFIQVWGLRSVVHGSPGPGRKRHLHVPLGSRRLPPAPGWGCGCVGRQERPTGRFPHPLWGPLTGGSAVRLLECGSAREREAERQARGGSLGRPSRGGREPLQHPGERENDAHRGRGSQRGDVRPGRVRGGFFAGRAGRPAEPSGE